MLTDKIVLTAEFTDTPSNVEIYQPSGGGSNYHILVDRRYQGVIINHAGEWAAYLNENSILNFEPLSVLIDMIILHKNFQPD